MDDLIAAHLEAGDYAGLALGVTVGLAVGLFAAALWLRLFRWIFALFGLKA